MDKREIKELLVQIKICFPRFAAVEIDQNSNQYAIRQMVADSWHDRIGWMEKERALAILDDYMESGETKVPGISLWMHSGKTIKSNVWHSAVLDRRHNVIRWQPEGSDKVFELHVKHPMKVIGFDDSKPKKPILKPDESIWEDEDGRLWAVPEGGNDEQ